MLSPLLVLLLLIVGLLALLPTWRLAAAGWPGRWLTVYWLLIAGSLFLVLRLPPVSRVLLPIVVLAAIAPFVAVPERLTRVLGGRPPSREPEARVDVVTPSRRQLPSGHVDADGGGDRTDPA